jgi:hypothetical protein
MAICMNSRLSERYAVKVRWRGSHRVYEREVKEADNSGNPFHQYKPHNNHGFIASSIYVVYSLQNTRYRITWVNHCRQVTIQLCAQVNAQESLAHCHTAPHSFWPITVHLQIMHPDKLSDR